MGLPTNSDHLSTLARSEMIEDYAGSVDVHFGKASVMRKFVDVSRITGTDTKIVRRVGKTTLKAITPGVRPDADAVNFGRVGVTVDTVILARNNRDLLNELQTDFSARTEIGKDHGKIIAEFFDQAFLIQAIKGAHQSAPANLNGAIGGGHLTNLTTAGDEEDADKLYAAISGMITDMKEDKLPTGECSIFVRPRQFEALLNHDKLIDRDFSASNGDFAEGRLATILGVPIMESTELPTSAITGHKLSNSENSNAYDLSAAEAKAVAVIMHPQSLLAGETIPLTSDIYYNKEELQWFIDSYLAFGASTRRPDLCGVVNKA